MEVFRVIPDIDPPTDQFIPGPDDAVIIPLLPDLVPRGSPFFIDFSGGKGLQCAYEFLKPMLLDFRVRVMKNQYDAVKMFRHDHMLIENQVVIMIRQVLPAGFKDLTVFVQYHGSVFYLSKNFFSVLGTDRDGIICGVLIIPFLQAGGGYAVLLSGIGHAAILFFIPGIAGMTRTPQHGDWFHQSFKFFYTIGFSL